MQPRTVLVFVGRTNGIFMARSDLVDAIHPSSASVAVRRCGARHFDVAEVQIEVAPAGDGVMRATVIERDSSFLWVVLSWLAALVCGIAAVEIMSGGRW